MKDELSEQREFMRALNVPTYPKANRKIITEKMVST